MAQARVEHIFNCSEDTFWNKLFFDEEYNRWLFQRLEFLRWTPAVLEDDGFEIRRVVDAVPKMADLPGPIKKLIGDSTGYREEGCFDRKTRRYRVKIIPNKLADKLTIDGELHTEPAGDNKCKRIYVAKVEAKVFGIGGMLEKRVIADVESGYAAGARFSNEFIAEKRL